MATSNLLKETSRTQNVVATASDADNLYDVTYKTDSGNKKLLNCTVNIKGQKDNMFKGSMVINETGQINTNFNDPNIDTVAMMTLFNSIIAEIKAGLTA